MISEKAKTSIAELLREGLIDMLYELTNQVHELKEQLRL
jgi:hypothetical protein